MIKDGRQSLNRLLVVAALVAPFVFFASKLLPNRGDRPLNSAIQELIYPVQFAWNRIGAGLYNSWNSYIDLVHTAHENVVLKNKIKGLETRTLDYESKVRELDRLQQLMGFVGKHDLKLLPSIVIGTANTNSFEILRLGRGSKDGVKVGMPVIASQGVVGRIIRTGLAFSDVLLITDSKSSLDVLVERTRVRGIIQGSEGGRLKLELRRRTDIKIGDEIVTSGIVGSFQKGLPVGRVIRIEYTNDDLAQTVTVDPWVDYRQVEEVAVVENEDSGISQIEDIAGKDWLELSLLRKVGG
ncbi:MAG: rod shape-determining protein MreC [Pseudomonadota bacterium]